MTADLQVSPSAPYHASLAVRVRLMLGNEIALGPGKIELLEAIRVHGSISQAGKQLGMSYRRAWMLVDTMNRCFQQPLVETSAGGSHGGGATLTALGETMIAQYRTLQQRIEHITQQHAASFALHLRASPLPMKA
jgi:molybdate transport system regulatory protein